MGERDVYLDTSALAKRYLKERDSDKVDELYRNAEMGKIKLHFSLWNIGEVCGVFDKHRENTNPKSDLELLLGESTRLVVSGRLNVMEISNDVVMGALEIVLKYHIYVADALQLATAHIAGAKRFVTADKMLIRIAKKEGFDVIELAG
jgi:predicted nucleic acid-binding protein